MITSNIKAVIQSDIHKVWETVREVESYAWRSDLSKTEILSEKQFVEYTKKGFATIFTITAAEPYKRWEFDLENSGIKGHWIGVFTQNGEETEVDFTEKVFVKKFFLKPFAKSYLKKQQARFISDLQRALS